MWFRYRLNLGCGLLERFFNGSLSGPQKWEYGTGCIVGGKWGWGGHISSVHRRFIRKRLESFSVLLAMLTDVPRRTGGQSGQSMGPGAHGLLYEDAYLVSVIAL